NVGDGNVSVIDTSSNTVVATVPVGSAPYGVAVNREGTRVYVTNEFSETVSVIDTSTNTVVAIVVVGQQYPEGVAVTPDGPLAYVAHSAFFNRPVSVIDTSSNTVVATVPVGTTPEAFGNFIATVPCASRRRHRRQHLRQRRQPLLCRVPRFECSSSMQIPR